MFESIPQKTPSPTELARAQHLYSLLPIPLIIVNTQLQVFFSNEEANTLFGHQQSDAYDLRKENTINKRFIEALKQKLACFIRSDNYSTGKLNLSRKNKPDIYLDCKFHFFDPHRVKEREWIIITFSDVTMEENLSNRINTIRNSFASLHPGKLDENRLFKRLNEAVLQSANTIVITNIQGDIVFANPKFEETTGYTPEEAYMKNPRILKSGDQDEDYYKNLWQTISSGKVWKGEFKNKNKWGNYYWESAIITPIKDAGGKVMEYLAIKEDITERKLIEQKLEKTLLEMEVSNRGYKMLNHDLKQEVEHRKAVEDELKLQKQLLVQLNQNLESQVEAEVKKNRKKDELLLLQSRQAAMGEMIGNIAHQWRQPLNIIGLMVYDLTDAFRFNELTTEYIDQSEKDIAAVLEHMSNTIDDFRNFFKPNKEKTSFRLTDVVNTSISFLDATLKGSGINLVTEINKGINLYGYPSEFAQVLLNILNNARDAINENNPGNPYISIKAQQNDFNQAVVIIANNGGGIPQNILQKIFEPYFTTKEPGKGTGVGLYMTKTIIERNMSGSINAQNYRDGVRFILTIPLEIT